MRHKNKYVIGYDDDYNPVYGKAEENDNLVYVNPMTLKKATKKIRELVSNYPKAVYKLVKVREIK
jgi:hypothetical protein